LEPLLDRLSKACAIVGGALVVGITLIVTGSILGRWLLASPLLGDVEIIEFGMAIIVACFLPICQWRGANIIVDFFTSKASQAGRDRLDRIGALLVGVMMGLIAWRTAVGAIDQKNSGSLTMMLQWPEWIAYTAMCFPLTLTAVIALYTAATGRNGAAPVARDVPVPTLQPREPRA
jgi:TRAP-type C4-dicarboxylate transport system permease small subunit